MTREDGLIPLRQAAKTLGRSSRQVRRMIKQGRIEARNEWGRYYFLQSVIDKYLGHTPKEKPK